MIGLGGGSLAKFVYHRLPLLRTVVVEINPEARVKVLRGPAKARLVQGGWTSFLIKVHNDAGVTAALEVESVNAAPVLHISTFEARVLEKKPDYKGATCQSFFRDEDVYEPPFVTKSFRTKIRICRFADL